MLKVQAFKTFKVQTPNVVAIFKFSQHKHMGLEK
jgi:hypothetical protein